MPHTGFAHAKMAADQGLDSPLSFPFDMVAFEPGTFWMGSPSHEVGRFDDEVLTEVTLTASFALSETMVSQGHWLTYHDDNPGAFFECGDDCPVERMSWDEAARFANMLSAETGLSPCYNADGVRQLMEPKDCDGFRMPTEAEWEYAARAGETSGFWYGGEMIPDDYDRCDETPLFLTNGHALDDFAVYCNNSGGRPEGTPRDVGSLLPGPQGLYDLLGQMFEWAHDVYAEYPPGPLTDPRGPDLPADHAHRSTSWSSAPQQSRFAARHVFPSADQGKIAGIRLARTLP